MGPARASRAVFRALAENHERTRKFRRLRQQLNANGLDARRVQQYPRRVCSPSICGPTQKTSTLIVLSCRFFVTDSKFSFIAPVERRSRGREKSDCRPQ